MNIQMPSSVTAYVRIVRRELYPDIEIYDDAGEEL